MKNRVKIALLSGGFTILGAIIGVFGTQSIQNSNSLFVHIDGEERKISKEKYEIALERESSLEQENEKISAENEELSEKINSLSSEIETVKQQLEEKNTSSETDELMGDESRNEKVGSVSLFDLTAFIGDFELEFTNGMVRCGDDTDNLGNTYTGGYRVNIDNAWDKEAVFAIDKKYSTISGTIALHSNCNEITDGIWIEFYDGERLIAETEHLYAGVRPISYEYDISNVDELKVVFAGTINAQMLMFGPYLK